MKINLHIEIVSSEIKGLSSMSKESRDAICKVLSKHYTNVGITLVNSVADLEALTATRPDLIFLGMMYVPIDPTDIRGPLRIWLTDYFNERDILSTGSSQPAHKLDLNKSLAKQCVLDAGLMTSPFYVIEQSNPTAAHSSLLYPLFVKPLDRGGGVGIDSNSVVRDAKALLSKVDSLSKELASDSLVEQYLSGREFSVAILKDEFSENYLAMPIELDSQTDDSGIRVLSSQIKEANAEIVAEVTDPKLYAAVSKLALGVFLAMGARDYGRIDIRLDELGVPNFLEANLIPSLISGYGSFPKSCLMNLGLEYEPMILKIVRLGLAHKTSSFEAVRKPRASRRPKSLLPQSI